MEAKEIISYISQSKKKTPVKVYIRRKNRKESLQFEHCQVFDIGDCVVFGDWNDIEPVLEKSREDIEVIVIEQDRRNSGIPLLDMRDIPARIEPGAIIREKVTIGKNAIIMMGAVINIGAVIGEGTMVDMGAVLGGRAKVGARCHIGAGAVLAGVIEPASARPVVIEDDVLIGANAVVLEGVCVRRGAVVAAGAVVTKDVPPGMVVAGNPARMVKTKDAQTASKTDIVEELRQL